MDLPTFQALLAPDGRDAVTAAEALAPTDATLLACITRLQKRFPPPVSRAAVETALLRGKARDKFSRAGSMFFTRTALEQASSELIARYRAERFVGLGLVGDFCCGIGGDAIGLAGRGPIVAVDVDPVRVAMAAANLETYGLRDRVELAAGDLLQMRLPDVAAAFLDPDRRARGRRQRALGGYEPALDAVRQRLPAACPLGVKVAPGVPWSDLEALDAEAEFISVGGELKECALWFGPFRSCARRATLLPAGATLWAEVAAPVPGVGAPQEYLYDPDPAVIRSGLVTNLAQQLGARLIDSEIAFLTAPILKATPFARAYHVLDVLPFQRKRLTRLLRTLGVGRVTIVKRGSPLQVDDLTAQLKLRGSKHCFVILTRVLGQPYVLISQPV